MVTVINKRANFYGLFKSVKDAKDYIYNRTDWYVEPHDIIDRSQWVRVDNHRLRVVEITVFSIVEI